MEVFSTFFAITLMFNGIVTLMEFLFEIEKKGFSRYGPFKFLLWFTMSLVVFLISLINNQVLKSNLLLIKDLYQFK
jgi:hypothetical protein